MKAPVAEMAAQVPRAMRLGFRLFGKRFLPEYPFEEAFFLPYARQFRDTVGPLLGSPYDDRTYVPIN